MSPPPLPTDLLSSLADQLRARHWMMATAESCTGGLIAAACTDRAGSSEWFDRGFVTYSNEAKIDMLGVLPSALQSHGAVSEAVAMAMAAGALQRSRAQLTLAVTGIAGPTGAVAGKPVGTVWLALAHRSDGIQACMRCFKGDRHAVRQQTVDLGLRWLLQTAQTGSLHPAPTDDPT